MAAAIRDGDCYSKPSIDRAWIKLPQPEIRKTDGWHHQVTAYHFANAQHEATLLGMWMGTGKSKVAIDLVVNWGCRRVLILCPVSVLQVWPRQFRLHGPEDARVLVLDKGGNRKRVERAHQFLASLDGMELGVVLINYESAWREHFAAWSLLRSWDCVILDESHRIKSHNSAVSRYAAKLRRVAARRLCLTGTPANTPLDIFGQLRFLDPGILGTSFVQFRNHYAICGNPMIPQQVTGYKNQDELRANFRLLAYQVGPDVLDLPPVQHHVRTFDLCPFARQVYRDLETELIAQIGEGTVTAANALVRLLRLQQLTSGFAVTEQTEEEVAVDEGKRNLLIDLLTDIPQREPVVVFCRFRHDLRVVWEVAQATGRRWGELSGTRKDLVDAMLPESIDLLGVQVSAGGLGVDLTRSHYAVYYSKGFSRLEYDQSLARLVRKEQTQSVQHYHLVANNTVDEHLEKVLVERKDVISGILETYRKELCHVV
ncbi:MAG TPA: DEAD/DEAH box helicase [Thermoguttaceae bacterium]|nr:DEAD/DEAH box helicase [Thermoguttaceae bacterium]